MSECERAHTFLTLGAGPLRGTEAAVAVDLVHAAGAQGAGRRLALVDVCSGGSGERDVRGESRDVRGTLLRDQEPHDNPPPPPPPNPPPKRQFKGKDLAYHPNHMYTQFIKRQVNRAGDGGGAGRRVGRY